MLVSIRNALLIMLVLTTAACQQKNHIDKYKVDVEQLKTLPDNFYAYRRGTVYLEDLYAKKYRIWYQLDNNGNADNILRIDDFKYHAKSLDSIIQLHAIDTITAKATMQHFIDLSRRYHFGHISVDKANQIFFSNKDGLPVQFVYPLNDSIQQVYRQRSDFRLLDNGWFEYVEQ